mmetsp:Transcript_1110/g.3313  ORF Transcript_1110/g.3313 Transcript_1110/m.3313 type:complete len:219 (-) Transcript_1110:178-834(-)
MAYPQSDPRVQQLLELGFWLPDCEQALEAAEGDLEKAAAILLSAEVELQHKVVRRINGYLCQVRPWSEFFDHFLWPEHLQERVDTNVAHYHANYAVICVFLAVIWTAAVPGLLLRLLLSALLAVLALADQEGAIPSLGQIPGEMVVVAAGGVALLLLMPYVFSVARLTLLCGAVVLGHASFRARSLPSRWSRFSKTVQKNVAGVTRDVKQKLQNLSRQ